MKVVMNEVRKNVVEVLKNASAPMTLNEIASAMGVEKVASGTTNAMVSAGLIKAVGVKRVPVVKYVEVNVYEIGDLSVLEK